MGRTGIPKRVRDTSVLPHDVLHIIFSKLEFHDKVSCGLVCKQWDALLKIGTATARHWIVDYNVNTILSKTAFATRSKQPFAEKVSPFILRYVTVLCPFP